MSVAGCDVEDPQVFKLAIKAGHARAAAVNDDTSLEYQARRERREEMEAGIARSMLKHEATSRVYYARLGNRVKIGYTHNVRKRMADLMAEELLATERGGLELEAERHRRYCQRDQHGSSRQSSGQSRAQSWAHGRPPGSHVRWSPLWPASDRDNHHII